MAGRLTENTIQSARAREKLYKLYDESGLFLLIVPSGGKWWRIKYRFDRKEKQLSLGAYPKVSLQEVRVLRDNIRQMVKQGIDPSAVRKAEKAERMQEKMEQDIRKAVEQKQSKIGGILSVRFTMDGPIEIWKGGNVMSFYEDEARFVAKQLLAITEVKPCR